MGHNMSQFLYRPVLADVTKKALKEQLDPYQAYAYFCRIERELGLKREVYLSSSVTSGGHLHNPAIKDIKEVIAKNTASALLIANQLAADSQIDPRVCVEGVALGYTGWKQSEYIEFWLMMLGGLALSVKEDIDVLRVRHRVAFELAGIDFDIMNGSEPPKTRAKEYFTMAQKMADLYFSAMRAQPVRKMIRLVDPDTSLGAQSERVFARSLKIPVFSVAPMQPALANKLKQVNPTLYKDVEKLITYGATVFDVSQRAVRLVVVEEEDLQPAI